MSPARRARRGARGPALGLILAALALGTFVPDARAHATLVRSVPPDATALTTTPREIRLYFSEPLVPALSRVRLRNSEGQAVGGVSVDARSAGSRLLKVSVPRLPRGAYTVEWRVSSTFDVHFMSGGIAFAVGTKAAPAPRSSPRRAAPLEIAEVVFRWLNLLFLAGLVGGLAVAALVLQPETYGSRWRDEVRRVRDRALRFGIWAGVLAVAANLGFLTWRAVALADTSPSSAVDATRQLLDTRWGVLWSLREIGLVALIALVFLNVPRSGTAVADPPARSRTANSPPRLSSAAAVLLVLGLVYVQALMSHAAALDSSQALALGADALHVLAASVWIGGLFALIAALFPALRSGSELARVCLRRFTPLAAASVGVVAATGLLSAAQQVGSLDDVLSTVYGRTLLGKIGLLLGSGLLGLSVTLLLRPALVPEQLRRRLSARQLPRLLAFEAAVGVLLLLGAGVLTSAAPARGFDRATTPPPPSALSRTVGDLLLWTSVKPNRPGPNVITVRAISLRRPALAEIHRVRVRLAPAYGSVAERTLVTKNIGPGVYRVGGEQLTASGVWRIGVAVERPGLEEVVARFDWRVGSPNATRLVPGRQPFRPVLTGVAAALVALVLGAIAVWAGPGLFWPLTGSPRQLVGRRF